MAPIETCLATVPLLSEISGLSFVALSPWYRTAAIPHSDMPDFCNGVIRLQGEIDPVELLFKLQEIEERFGRERLFLNAPRTVDLDIIDLNGQIRAIIGDGDFSKRMIELGGEPVAGPPEELGTRLKSDVDMWAAVVKKAGLEPQ